MTEEAEGQSSMWGDGKTLYDVVPVLEALVETVGRDLVLEEYALARAAADMAAALIVEQRESTGIADEKTALLVVRALAESAAATERALDGSSS
ncbi:hypothetical protein ABT160_24440 [Streptomyces sp. NPDC001941]|uniref:hypothetical protein n=1 Tax=Streptomyces sp. NPDC001941 TaxID=3154659 RepID=UPI00332B87E8